MATNSLVVHGQSVPVGAYPWLAALFAVRDTGLNYLCSASLVSDRHVVTGKQYFLLFTRIKIANILNRVQTHISLPLFF